MSWELAVQYRQVALVAAGWEGQESDLRSASDLVEGVAAGAFPGPVRGAVGGFRDAWARHLTAVALGAGGRAAGLRAAVDRYVASDEATALEMAAVLALVGEHAAGRGSW